MSESYPPVSFFFLVGFLGLCRGGSDGGRIHRCMGCNDRLGVEKKYLAWYIHALTQNIIFADMMVTFFFFIWLEASKPQRHFMP